jgi:ATP-dependent helicase/DNAse subunit B
VRDHGRVPLTLLTGPANSAKARSVLDGVRASLEREPLLVVPTSEDVVRYRRELAEDGLVLGARVATFADLLREIARRAGTHGRPLSELARERVVGAVVGRAELRVLAASAATPGFARAAGRLFAELEVARVDPGRLAAGLRAWAGDDAGRAAYGEEVARLYGAYRASLDRLGRPDHELWALGALDALRLAPAAWGGTPVFFYGFDDLTPLQLDAVEALAKRVDADVWVSLTFESGRVAFAGRASTVAELQPLADTRVRRDAEDRYYAPSARAALHALERRLFEDGGEAPVDPAGAVALLEAGGERAEAELVAAEVLRLLDASVPPDEIAVVARTLDDAAPVLERVFADFAIPFSLRRTVPFARTALGRGLLALLRCAALDGAAGDLVAYLRAPGVLRQPELADGLERSVRRRGAATAADALRLWTERWEEPTGLAKVRRAAQRGADALCEALAAELTRMLAGAAAAAAPAADPPAAAPEGADPGEPLAPPLLDAGGRAEARAAAAARKALSELAALSRDAPPLAPTPGELAAHLGGVGVLVGDPPGPGRVTVCDPLALRARRVRALVLCGLQEGAFPRAASPEPFLSDAERRELARASGIVLPRHEDALGAERYLFYATVSRPEERLVLATRTADDDGDPAVPSFFLDDVRDVLAPLPKTHRPLGAVAWDGPPPTARAAARAAAAAGPPRRPAPIAGPRGRPPPPPPPGVVAVGTRELGRLPGQVVRRALPARR